MEQHRPIRHKRGPGKGIVPARLVLPPFSWHKRPGGCKEGSSLEGHPFKTRGLKGVQGDKPAGSPDTRLRLSKEPVHCSDALNHNRAGGAEQP